MKKITLILAVVLSFTYTYAANRLAATKTNHIDSLYVTDEEADEAFDFDHKAYLPKDFQAYDLTDNEADISHWIEEDNADEAFDFSHTDYLPVGFNPSEELNALFLDKIKWIDEEEDAIFDFDTKKYIKKEIRVCSK